MKCPRCKNPDSKVVDSRPRQEGRLRRRQCEKCGMRFSTTEMLGVRQMDLPLLTPSVLKRNGMLMPFERQKLHNSIAFAVRKPNRDKEAIEQFVGKVEQEVSLNETDISSAELGERVMEWLRQHDQMGYLRYASVHKELNVPEDFAKLISRLRSKKVKKDDA